MGIKQLKLVNFRNHFDLFLDAGAQNILIYGPNGAGKTNILEAISLLAPGKGIFNSPNIEILNSINGSKTWEIFCELGSEHGVNNIGSGFNSYQNKRIFKLNESNVPKSAELLELIRIIWLVPQMDGILGGSNTEKRKLFDRITFNFFPSHAKSVSRYEYAIKSRSKLLNENYFDPLLLKNFEKILAEESVNIINARKKTINLICSKFKSFKTSFLYPSISIQGRIERDINDLEFSEQIEQILQVHEANRKVDTYSKRCTYGTHKSEIVFVNQAKSVQANLCSTGEKKAMLISLIIAQAKALRDVYDGAIILLLDDIFSHLDINFSRELIEELKYINAQIWISATQGNISLCKDFVKICV